MYRGCIDLSALVALVLPTNQTKAVDALWDAVGGGQVVLMAPPLLFVDFAALLRIRAVRGELSLEDADSIHNAALALGIQELNPPGLREVAWDLSRSLGLPRAADSFYLALAQMGQCPLWTADRRLYNRVHGAFEKLVLLELPAEVTAVR